MSNKELLVRSFIGSIFILVVATLSLYVEKNSFAEWLLNDTNDDVALYPPVKPRKISDHWRYAKL